MALTKRKHPEGDVTTQILKILFQVFPDPWFFKLKKKNLLLLEWLLCYEVVTL